MPSIRTILLVDDDEDDLDFFKTTLATVNNLINCITINDADTALSLLKSKSIIPDVIVSDLHMPGMDGKELLLELKNDTDLKQIPVIIFSTSNKVETITETIMLGAKGYITKPSRISELKKILTAILTQSPGNLPDTGFTF